ncbi:methyltransferase domain-containing protein [Rhizobium bangladeshense]|uniref:methyltransferase domain-containing protein n=1 Tax=Rhizobium bangladeshense TaxID=1138189 RepID=UPI00287F6BA1|nr:methyltransferase domain-containing protein [Rhizobium bangladeshense]
MTSILEQLLSVFWLRPETAIWRYLDIEAMKSFEFEGRSLDFGCGDGVFSFIRAGGRFSAGFDAFQKTEKLDRFYQNVDVYDAYDDSYDPLVASSPSYQISVGFDHKANLLRKAAALNFYKETIEGDGNAPLPFDDNSFGSIFSNIVYWLDNPAEVMSELGRILAPGGKICLMLPNETLPQFSFYNSLYAKTKDEQWKWLELLDRGRLSDNIKQSKSDDAWREIFRSAGLSVSHHSQHLPKVVIQAWDIGFRPMFPALMNMVASVDPQKLPSIKAEWIDALRMFAKPLTAIGQRNDSSSAFHCYILTK